jgi:hypothetical protein
VALNILALYLAQIHETLPEAAARKEIGACCSSRN